MLFAGLQEKDVDLVISAFSVEAMNELWRESETPEEKKDILFDYMEEIGRDNTLNSISYQFNKDPYNVEENEGKLHFKYITGETITVPFHLYIQHGHDKEIAYQLSTSLLEISDTNYLNNKVV